VTELSPADHAELLSRLTALQQLALELSEVFDNPQAQEGAREMLASIERMLALLGADAPQD